jgi:hypothetical protein
MRKIIALASVLISAPALAADEPPRMAFGAAIAPEQAFEVCHLGDAVSAAECALEQCKKASGNEECVVVAACGFGWSGTVGISTGEIHWTEVVCGAPSKASLIVALRAFCDGNLPSAKECYLSSVWDDRGRETKMEKSFKPKKIK